MPRNDDNAPRNDDAAHIVVGVIRSAWGLRGDVSVEPLSDAPDRFAPGGVLHLKGKPTRIERARPSKRGLLLKLDAVADRTQAEALRGERLTILPDQAAPLPDGVYYHYQIIGMRVQTDAGEPLGVITEIIVTGGNDVYVIAKPGSRDLLIPALPDVVLDVDVPNALMLVSLPDGLR